ncbi:MAG TPA: hypothetical protein VFD58_27795 [Blastocatellia bacterium]|nr:hypothetical protein [Blastocatellia bacterium]
MKARYLIVSTLAAGITIFLWGAVSHMAIPWPETALREFKDNGAIVAAVRAQTPGNGVYLAPQGVFMAVSLRPDLADKTQFMGPSLVRQFLFELAVGFVLSLILLWIPARTPLAVAGLFGLLAIAAGVEQLLPEWNWYGFSAIYTALEFVDLVVGWCLAGLVIGALRRHFLNTEAATRPVLATA